MQYYGFKMMVRSDLTRIDFDIIDRFRKPFFLRYKGFGYISRSKLAMMVSQRITRVLLLNYLLFRAVIIQFGIRIFLFLR